MTLPRVLFVAVLLAAVGVAMVTVRHDMARTSFRVQRLHQQRIALQRDNWAREMELARLRVPADLRERVTEMSLPVSAPHVERKATRTPESRARGVVRTHD